MTTESSTGSTRRAGRPGPDRHNCAWGDANDDGLLDVFCSVGRQKANNVKPADEDDELWLQGADGSFSDVGTAWGVGDPRGRGRATTFIDVNHDAFPDLFVGNEVPRADDVENGAGGENKLFINQDGQSFVDSPAFGLNQITGSRCAHVLDYNNDGWDDLFVCGSPDGHLYENEDGRSFQDRTSATGITAGVRAMRDADFGDLDGDGDLDIVYVNRTDVTYQLFADGSWGPPQEIGAIEEGQAVALGDADGNGFLDVYAVGGGHQDDAPDLLFLNAGLTFSPLVVPATNGVGNSVESLDYDGDGRDEFLVLNGEQLDISLAGPVQLLRLGAVD